MYLSKYILKSLSNIVDCIQFNFHVISSCVIPNQISYLDLRGAISGDSWPLYIYWNKRTELV